MTPWERQELIKAVAQHISDEIALALKPICNDLA
jgi:hypothetical protein